MGTGDCGIRSDWSRKRLTNTFLAKKRTTAKLMFCEPTSILPPADFRLQALDRPSRILPPYLLRCWNVGMVPLSKQCESVEGNRFSMSVQMEQGVRSLEISEIAEARLSASSHPALRKVYCKYDDGVLVLRGRLNSFFHTQLAQETVRKINGVERVVNMIEVLPQAI